MRDLRFRRAAAFAFVLVVTFLASSARTNASGGSSPTPNPRPTPIDELVPTPTPIATPTIPPIKYPTATPTVPPTGTPTVPPIKYPTATPTVPPVNPPSPTPLPTGNPPPVKPINPTSILQKADPALARALVRYGQNGLLTLANDQGRFQKVALQPNQVVTVTLTLSAKDYGKAAEVLVLDGGAMSSSVDYSTAKDIIPATPTPYPTQPPNGPEGPEPTPQPVVTPPPIPDPSTLVDAGQLMTVSQAGELVFSYKAGADIGLHRVAVMVGDNQYFLQFWRQDPSAPNNNPRMLRAY